MPSLYAPQAYATFSVRSGAVYIADINGLIADVQQSDLPDLLNAGCLPAFREAAKSSGWSMTAARAIGGHRAAVITPQGLAIASSDDPDHLGRVVGVTLHAANAGLPVAVQAMGAIAEPSFAFSGLGPVYFDADGRLTRTPPIRGFQQQVGVAVGPSTLFVDIGPPILLSS